MSKRREEYDGAPELEGVILYEPDWYLLVVPAEGHAALLGLIDALGVPTKPVARPHVAVMKA